MWGLSHFCLKFIKNEGFYKNRHKITGDTLGLFTCFSFFKLFIGFYKMDKKKSVQIQKIPSNFKIDIIRES